MKFGYFDDKNREYVITNPRTPWPWINYLGNEDFFSLISNSAGGYTFYKDAKFRRITRYRYNNVPMDSGGKYFYIKDGESIWSPGWKPCKTELDSYECRHGMNYTIITGKKNGVTANVLYFVPLKTWAEVQKLTLTNDSGDTKKLKVFSFLEWCLWNAASDMENFQRNFSTGEVEIQDSVIYHKTEYKERRDHYAWYSVNVPVQGYDTDRESFFGLYNGFDEPQVVAEGKPHNTEAHGWSPIASHYIEVELKPGESKDLIFVLGYVENKEDEKWESKNIINKKKARETIARFDTAAKVDAALADLRKYWDNLLSIYTVRSGDDKLDRIVNIWNQYQCMITFCFSRSASFFESGIGRGMGFRDSNQDLLGFVHMIPARARRRILDLAATQLPTGGASHQYQPLTKRGNNDVGGNFNDDPAWLILGVAAYLKESGDWSILDERVPYDNKPELATPLYEHLQRSFQYTLDRLGPHGLPLIGRADWNDCLNLNCFSEEPGESFQTTTNREGTVAESVFIAGLFVLAAHELADIADHLQNAGEAKRYRAEADRMEETVKTHGWDGGWFLRAYDAFGNKVGSKECEEGRVFIESNGMCVMAGIGLQDSRAEQALAAVNDHLATPHGIVLQQPAYSRYYVHMGEISSYPPGYKENAGIFCHTNPWIMIAETLVGHADLAFDYYSRINPSQREAISEVHRCEPYVYAQMIAGKDAATHGEAKNSWLTGTAAWNFAAITQYILGIQPTLNGLKIAPVIPTDWPGFSATRVYRGVTYHIQVVRAGKGNAVALRVDGKVVEGNVVPPPAEGTSAVKVDVVVG